MNETKQRVAIVGAGITGLTAAFYLQKEINEKKLPIELTLFEGTDRLGGMVQTDYSNGYIIEEGPDSLIARKAGGTKLIKEVGLEDQLVRNHMGRSYILAKDKLYPMPGGAIMGIPTKLAPFATTGLFSPVGKLRAAFDLILPRSPGNEDQSLGHFFRRRLGNEVVDNLIEPLLSGIYAGNIDQLSLMSTFPQFYEVEQKYRSLILGMGKTTPKQPKSQGDKKSVSAFISLKTGLYSLVKAIENKLDPKSIRLNTPVKKVRKAGDQYEVYTDQGNKELFDSVIMTTGPKPTMEALSDYSFASILSGTPVSSVATVALAYPESAIKKDINGTGFVVSRSKKYSITACTWTHKKWPHTTPEGKALLRGYVGKAGDDDIVCRSDEEIIEAVLKDLNLIMEIDQDPEFYKITRWVKARPQYVVGHKERVETLMREVAQHLPGLYLAGAPYYGAGVPDCIDQGENAVQQVLDHLKKHQPALI